MIYVQEALDRITKKVWCDRVPFAIERKESGKGPDKTTEMSDYFDYAQYDRATRAHAFYQDMVAGMINALKKEQARTGRKLRVLEIGCGNGSLTDELVRLENIEICSTDVDENAVSFLQGRLRANNLKVFRANALTYRTDEPYDVVIASWNYEHITNYTNGSELGKAVVANLKNRGVYIEGVELVDRFYDERSRQLTFINYHEWIIDRALEIGNQDTAEIEWGAMVSGITGVSHFKRSRNTHLLEIAENGLRCEGELKYGPFAYKIGEAGVYLFVFRKGQS